MKRHNQRRGSVLMEFIIVFPIYLILFAGTVAIGDMLIHSNRLASADRVAAQGVDGWTEIGWSLVTGAVFHPGVEIADDGTNQDRVVPVMQAHYANKKGYAYVTGPWTVCALGSASNRYKLLAGGTLGQLLAARLLTGGDGAAVLDQLAGGIDMVSKDTRNGASYYTLKRRRSVVSWRDFTSGLLPNERWLKNVADEAWHDDASVFSGRTSCSEVGSIAELDCYHRYPQFVTWSE